MMEHRRRSFLQRTSKVRKDIIQVQQQIQDDEDEAVSDEDEDGTNDKILLNVTASSGKLLNAQIALYKVEKQRSRCWKRLNKLSRRHERELKAARSQGVRPPSFRHESGYGETPHLPPQF